MSGDKKKDVKDIAAGVQDLNLSDGMASSSSATARDQGGMARTTMTGTSDPPASDGAGGSGGGGGGGSGGGSGGGKADGGPTISYTAERIIGNGSFGIVFQASVVGTNETVAIKKVLQDKRFKNRELQIMRTLDHPNIVQLKHCFFSTGDKDAAGKDGGNKDGGGGGGGGGGDKEEEVYLNLVLEYVPETVYRVARQYSKSRQFIPVFFVKLYMYQLCRSLAYLHGCGVCHRDIKPQNLLVDPNAGVLKLCDFGSAKMLVPGEPNVSYICSRYYRAPELIFGASQYTTAIDVWSLGCVVAELLLGQPLFPGESGVDQLVEIIKILGTPTKEEIQCMNQNYMEFKFPQIKHHPWSKVFRSRTPSEAIDLVSKLLSYKPNTRLTPMQAMLHPFFDELRKADVKMPSGRPMPALFNFTVKELKGQSPDFIKKLLPKHTHSHLSMPFADFLQACTSGN